MKISDLINLLNNWKSRFGDVEVRLMDTENLVDKPFTNAYISMTVPADPTEEDTHVTIWS